MVYKVAICFCGGCNPRIQREKVAAEIQQRLISLPYHVVMNQIEGVDYIIFISGCSANCALRYRKAEFCQTSFSVIAGESVDYWDVPEQDIAAKIAAKVVGTFKTEN